MNTLPAFLRRSLVAVAILGVAAPATVFAQPTKNIILVHGAWADGSSWSKVIPLLDAKGFNVVAVQLPLTSLSDDAAAVKRAIALETGPVLLVGHSYGGAVITEAGDDPKVKALVYVAAFAPDKGESAGSLTATMPAPPLNSQVRPDPNGFLKLTKEGIYDDFAQDLPSSEKEVLYVAQAPTNANALNGKISDPAWRSKPSWYIVAANDRAISPKLERTMAKTIRATTTTLQTSHVAMLAEPKAVVQVIERAAASEGVKGSAAH